MVQQMFHRDRGQYRRVLVPLSDEELQDLKRSQGEDAEVSVSYMKVQGAGEPMRPFSCFVSEPGTKKVRLKDLVVMTPVTVRGLGRQSMFFEGSHSKLCHEVEQQRELRGQGKAWKWVELWEDDTFRRKMEVRPDRIQIDEQPRSLPLPWVVPVPSEVPAVTPVVVTEMARVVPITSARRAVAKRPRSTRSPGSSPRPSVPPTAA